MLSSKATCYGIHQLHWNLQFYKQDATHPLQVSITCKPECMLSFVQGHLVLFTSMNCICWTPQPPDRCCSHMYSSLGTGSAVKEKTHWHLVAKEHITDNTKQCRCLSFHIYAVQRDAARTGMGRCSNSSCRRDGPSEKSSVGLNPPAQHLIATGTGMRQDSQKHYKGTRTQLSQRQTSVSRRTAVSSSFVIGRQRQKEVPTSYQDSDHIHLATASVSIRVLRLHKNSSASLSLPRLSKEARRIPTFKY